MYADLEYASYKYNNLLIGLSRENIITEETNEYNKCLGYDSRFILEEDTDLGKVFPTNKLTSWTTMYHMNVTIYSILCLAELLLLIGLWD